MSTATVLLDKHHTSGISALSSSAELESSAFLTSWRPWMTMYGLRLRHASKQVVCIGLLDPEGVAHTPSLSPFSSSSILQITHRIFFHFTHSRPMVLHGHVQVADLSLLQRKLPDELLIMVLSKLPPNQLGVVQCVCKQLQALCCTNSLWRPACVEAFWQDFSRESAPVATIHTLVRSHYR